MWIAVQTGLWALIIIAFLGPSLGAGAPAYPVYVCAGVVFFQFLTNFLVDGSAAFTKNVALIQNIPNPVSLYLLRAAAKSVILLVAQAPVVAAGLLYTGASPQWVWLLAAPNILLLTIVMSGMALTLASVTPQFRDIPFALNAAMRVMFFVTPVIWLVEQRGGVRALAAQYNPFAHFIALARDPFMGAAPPLQSVLVTLFAGLVSWSLGLALFARNRARIASQL